MSGHDGGPDGQLAPDDRARYIGAAWSSLRPDAVGRVIDVGADEVVVAWGDLTSCQPPEDLRIASVPGDVHLGPVEGSVKWWKREKGYGVVLTPDTAPKGIWVHFSVIDRVGFKELVQGEAVDIEYEAAVQDTFRFSCKLD